VTSPAAVPLFEPTTFQLKIDFDADAAYLRLSHERVARTRRFEGSESVLVKLDATGKPVGIEVIGLKTPLPIDRLAQVFNFSEPLNMSMKYVEEQLWQAAYAIGVGDAIVSPPSAVTA
jgi:uncharacterized protein YuzE